MIEYAHIHNGQRLFQRHGQRLVGTAGLGDAGGMVMRQSHTINPAPSNAIHGMCIYSL